MSAATTAVNTIQRSGEFIENAPIAAGVILYAGTLAAVNAAGYIVPASDTAALTVLGIVQEQPLQSFFDNSAGANGALSVTLKRGAFVLENSSGAPLTWANLGGNALVADDQTVAATSAHSIVAGIFLGFENGDTTQAIIQIG